jgi:hypothetical protein
VAGLGASLATGMAVGQQMAGALGQAAQPGAAQAPAQAGGPPPLPSAPSFYVAMDGKQAGPFDLAALEHQAKNGLLLRSSLVWKQGMAAWTPAEAVPELQGLFAAMPPPLPPRT